MRIFLKNRDKVWKHNQQFNEGIVSYSMSLNNYSDMDHSDFASSMQEMKYIRSITPM